MTLTSDLATIVGASQVLTDPDLTASYEVDWTGRFRGAARCVVRPGTTAEVAAILRVCAHASAPIIVQGGNTGLVGGGVPAGGEVVLSLTRLTQLGDVDTVAAQVSAGAGVTLAALARHAHGAGLEFGVDLAARGQATVGGLVATNAGGIRVLRHGSMRAQVVGAEAVLADGTILSRMTGLVKDNTGYDLSQLLCGSEGTLAVITAVRLRLVPKPGRQAVALIGLADTDAALAVLAAARAQLTLTAAEVFYAAGLALVRAHGRLPAPFTEEFPAYLVVECESRTDPTDELVELLAGCAGVGDATVAADEVGRARLWAYRETHTEAVNALGVPTKLDVCVPVGQLGQVVRRLPVVVGGVAPAAKTVVFGHINEGNLHINVLGAEEVAEEVTHAVLSLIAEYGGTISSEHGVGRAKTAWLSLSRSAEEIETMRRIKHALDPTGQLNPGVLLPIIGDETGSA